MQDAHMRRWGILEASVRGAGHVQQNMPNQDAKYAVLSEDSSSALLAVADGHGGKAYFRSDKGSRFAVNIAVEVMKETLQQLPDPTKTSRAMIEHFLSLMPVNIVERWRAQVSQHWKDTPLVGDEWTRVTNGLVELPEVSKHPTKPYGSTLLSVLVTPLFIFYSQLGDGDILVVTENGQVQRIVKDDGRLFANETTSLSAEHAEHDFRTTFRWLDEKRTNGTAPALIMMATDGYINSFSMEKGFLQVATDILNIIKQQGPEHVQQHLESWLQTATDTGSGDDITVVVLWNEGLRQSHSIVENSFHKDALHTTSDPESTQYITPYEHQHEEIISSTTEAVKSSKGSSQFLGKEEEQLIDGYIFAEARSRKTPTIASLLSKNFKEHAADKSITAVSDPHLRTLVVSPDPNLGDYTSIAEALKNVDDECKILVHSGTYREQLVIDCNVSIVGVGEPETIIIESAVPCIQISTPYAYLEGLRVHGQHEGVDPNHAAIEIYKGRPTLERCSITSSSNCTVDVHNVETHPILSKCKIQKGEGIGLCLSNQAACEIQQCEFLENQDTHIIVRANSQLFCSNSAFLDGKEHSMVICEGSAAVLSDCTISRSNSVGIIIQEKGKAEVKNCYITESGDTGLYVFDNANCIVSDSKIIRNKIAIQVERKSDIYLIRVNILHIEKEFCAICILESSTGEIEDCEISSKNVPCFIDNTSEIHFRDREGHL